MNNTQLKFAHVHLQCLSLSLNEASGTITFTNPNYNGRNSNIPELGCNMGGASDLTVSGSANQSAASVRIV